MGQKLDAVSVSKCWVALKKLSGGGLRHFKDIRLQEAYGGDTLLPGASTTPNPKPEVQGLGSKASSLWLRV